MAAATTFPSLHLLPKEIQREAQTLQDNYDEIKKHVGKFVLIQGKSVVAYSNTFAEAMSTGYKRFGLDNFLVRQVKSHDTPVRAMRCGLVKTDGKLRITRARAR